MIFSAKQMYNDKMDKKVYLFWKQNTSWQDNHLL